MKDEFREKYKTMGLKISYYRRTKDMTQEMLAEAADINATFLGQVECGARGISLDNLFKIAKVLEVPEYKFIKFDD